MVSPDKVQSEAKKRENENYKFRTYLKNRRNMVLRYADKLQHGGKRTCL